MFIVKRVIPPELRQLPDSIFDGHDTAIGRDLGHNLADLLDKSSLAPDEAGLVLLAVSTSAGLDALTHYARERLAAVKVPLAQMQEAAESAALFGMLGVYSAYCCVSRAKSDGGAPLRASVLESSLVGRPRFDMLAFCVSVLNGCTACVQAYERALVEGGVSDEKIHDLAKLAAVVKGLAILTRA